MTVGAMQHVAPTLAMARELAGERGACLSIYLPPHRPAGNAPSSRAALRTAIQIAAPRFRDRGLRGVEVEDLLRPLVDLAAQAEFDHGHENSWAAFRSPSRTYLVDGPADWREAVMTEDRFYLLPLLEWLGRHHACLLLAVTHKGVHVYRFVDGRLAELALPPAVPALFDEDRMRNAAEHGANRSGGVHFGVTATSDRAHRMYRDYFAEVARGLKPLFEREGLPVVLAGAKEVISGYRDAAGDPHLLLDALVLSPDGGLPERELEQRLSVLLAASPLAGELRAAQRIRPLGPAKAGTELEAVRRAAVDGRVATLFIASEALAESPGNQPGLNHAAAETLVHGGEVWVVPHARMPVAGPLVAELRY